MLRFLAGMVTGWVAARSLPPSSSNPLSFPTVDELGILTLKVKDILRNLQESIKKNNE